MSAYRTAHTGARGKGHHRAAKRPPARGRGLVWGFQMAAVSGLFLALNTVPGVFPW